MPLPLSIVSMALGRSPAGHGVLDKIAAAAQHSFAGIEIFYECLEQHAQALPGGLTEDNIVAAAHDIRQACDTHGIQVVCLQPFMFLDGLADQDARQEALARLQLWFRLVKILGTDLIQVPTNFGQTGSTGDWDTIVSDMRTVAEMGRQQDPVVRFAYEGLCWGTHIDTWDGAWDVVKAVDLPNLGHCMDTFHIAGRLWGDPTQPSGRAEGGAEALRASLDKMRRELDVNKIFYLQVGDARKLDPPLSTAHAWYDPAQPWRMIWGRNARLFANDTVEGGYLPVNEVAAVILKDLGYRGWVSLEMFGRELYATDADLPQRLAERGLASWKRTLRALSMAES